MLKVDQFLFCLDLEVGGAYGKFVLLDEEKTNNFLSKGYFLGGLTLFLNSAILLVIFLGLIFTTSLDCNRFNHMVQDYEQIMSQIADSCRSLKLCKLNFNFQL